MVPTVDQLVRIAGKADSKGNLRSLVMGLAAMGASAGLDQPHRLAHYLAQVMHESGGGQWDSEIWGPTPAQKRYDTRADLGNTPAVDGDGERYKGRTAGQITGRSNYSRLTVWVRSRQASAPDFVAHPEALNTDPWEGIGPIWFWDISAMNKLADENNIEQITKRWNGGLNGYTERLRYYARASLVLLGFAPEDVAGLQTRAQQNGLLSGEIDGDFGPKTRSAAHMLLVEAGKRRGTVEVNAPVAAGPVVVSEQVPVAPKNAEKTLLQRVLGGLGAGFPLAGMGGFINGLDRNVMFVLIGVGVVSTLALLLRGEWIAARVKAVLQSFEPAEG